MDWIKTDDLQYLRKIKKGVYELAEVRTTALKTYAICRDNVIIANWLHSDGEYDADCVDIVKMYYDSVEEFESDYRDKDEREQILAEMIFENMEMCEMRDYELFKKLEDAESRLEDYCK